MFKVKKKRCDECLYSKRKIVSDERRRDLLEQIRANDSYFVCHKSTIKDDGKVCCRGFYDNDSANIIRIAQRLSAVSFVD